MTTSDKLKAIQGQLNRKLIDRQDEILGLVLATLSKKNVLLFGAPGVGKSMLVTEFSKHIESANVFKKLLTRYTVPDELEGPVMISKLKKDIIERPVNGTINGAHFAFLDETFKGSSAILNSLLQLANERTFYNAGQIHEAPLMTLVGASNEFPDPEDGLDAFADRFHLSFDVRSISDDNLVQAMKNSMNPSKEQRVTISIEELIEAQKQIESIEVDEDIYELLIMIKSALKRAKVENSDRTYIESIRILQANAYLNGRSSVIQEDLSVLQHVLWSDPEQRDSVKKIIIEKCSPAGAKIDSIRAEVEAKIAEYKSLYDNLSDSTSEMQTLIEGLSSISAVKKDVKAIQSELSKKSSAYKKAQDLYSYLTSFVDEQSSKFQEQLK